MQFLKDQFPLSRRHHLFGVYDASPISLQVLSSREQAAQRKVVERKTKEKRKKRSEGPRGGGREVVVAR
jgi:hypothetical protein